MNALLSTDHRSIKNGSLKTQKLWKAKSNAKILIIKLMNRAKETASAQEK